MPNEAIVKALQAPEMKSKYAAIVQDLAWSTPEEFAAFIAEESAVGARDTNFRHQTAVIVFNVDSLRP